MNKRLNMQKPIAIITSLAMALSLVMAPGGVARAEAASVPEWAVDDGMVWERTGTEALPSRLDLRKKGLVTPVKQQSPWGTCWAFGAMAAAESGILADAGTTYDQSKLDLSERHLAWFAVHPVTEGIDPAQAGEGAYALRDGNDSFNTGGQNILVPTLFSQGGGPGTEQEFPYRGVDANGRSNTTEPSLSLEEFERDPHAGTLKVLAESNHKTESEIDALIKESAVADGISYEAEFKIAMDSARSLYEGIRYSGDDDWSIAPERRNVHSGLIIKDGNVLPSYREGDATEPSAASVEAIKRELSQGRGILINYRADQARPGASSDGTYLNRDMWAQYTFENVDGNHAVCIVGWDDDYPASNFAHTVYQRQKDASGNYVTDDNGNYVVVRDAEGNPIVDEECTRLSTPPGDGAWIVKNSWGSQTDNLVDDLGNVTGAGSYGVRDADGKATGYFYLSYHDRTISVPETMSFSSNLLGPTGRISIFQHDYMPAVGGFYSESSKNLMSSANVFDLAEADGDQVALSVGGRTFAPNQHVTFAVYQLNENASSPVDGRLLRRVSGTFEYAGYHRLDLDEDLPLRAGHRYSVVSTVSSREADGTVSYGVAANQGVAERIRRWQVTVPK